MKTKIIILLAASAIVTLSFTFASNSMASKKSNTEAVEPTQTNNEPAGGFASEDKF